jgi:hypothetical protein
MGYLSDDEQHQHELMSVDGESRQMYDADSHVDLETLLANKGGLKLNRHQRYKIAAILASSLLQLQSTPWLTSQLTKKNIIFYRQGSDIAVDHPYIHHSFPSSKSKGDQISSENDSSNPSIQKPTISPFAAKNASLTHLGILLLELCFGEPIEAQELRKYYLGSDGKAHAWTDYMTARDWAEMVCDEEPALEHIIKCCIFCHFEEKVDWENKKFVQAVYGSVVEPLEKIIGKWPTA